MVKKKCLRFGCGKHVSNQGTENLSLNIRKQLQVVNRTRSMPKGSIGRQCAVQKSLHREAERQKDHVAGSQ